MHSKVLAADVRRLSQSAARDESELISEKKLPHSTRLAMATSGSTMNSAPSAAGRSTQRGTPDSRCNADTSGLRETGGGQHGLALRTGDEVNESLGQPVAKEVIYRVR